MKYIKNTLDFSVSFKRKNGSIEELIEFDCFRVYSDTGNVATTGVTPISDDLYKELYENNRPFKDYIDSGKLVSTKKTEANSVAGKIDDLAKENEALKAELAKTKKELGTGETEAVTELKKDNEAKDAEIASLKAQLEAVKKESTETTEESAETTEGF